jgi:L-amino acid ligase C-terminal domain 2
MKLLGLEASQNSYYCQSRYQQIVDLGGDLYVLNGVGTDDLWPADRYRRAGSKHVDDIMREAHERGGAAHPSFRFVANLDEALRTAAEFGYPVILKPTLGAASNHLIEALAWDDEVYLGSIVDRVTVEGDTFDDDVHHAPTALSDEQVADVHALVRAGVRAQGLRRSALHAEVRYHQDKPFLLEIAGGVRPDVHHSSVHTAAMCLLCGSGTIESVGVPPEVTDAEGLYFLKITARPGDTIRRPPDGNNILGGIGALGTCLDDAMAIATDLAGKIEVRLAGDR